MNYNYSTRRMQKCHLKEEGQGSGYNRETRAISVLSCQGSHILKWENLEEEG